MNMLDTVTNGCRSLEYVKINGNGEEIENKIQINIVYNADFSEVMSKKDIQNLMDENTKLYNNILNCMLANGCEVFNDVEDKSVFFNFQDNVVEFVFCMYEDSELIELLVNSDNAENITKKTRDSLDKTMDKCRDENF